MISYLTCFNLKLEDDFFPEDKFPYNFAFFQKPRSFYRLDSAH